MLPLGPKHQIPIDISTEAKVCFHTLARTEDLRLSPDNKWLAFANYHLNCVTLFSIALHSARPERSARFAIENFWQLSSPTFKELHGLDFLDGRTLVVGNRGGGIDLLNLPHNPPMGGVVHVTPAKTIKRAKKNTAIQNPGSVCAFRRPDGARQILAANNYGHFISSHLLRRVGPFRKLTNEILISGGLDIPDGLAISDDLKHIAVSNHLTHEVLVYRNERHDGGFEEPCARLQKTVYPHGLRFTNTGNRLVVASAGSPFVHVYKGEDDNTWCGVYRPEGSFRVLDEQTFKAGAVNPMEGGPKGVEITANDELLLVTNEHAPLLAFDLQAMLKA